MSGHDTAWRITNLSPEREHVSYAPRRDQRKTNYFWSEREAKRLYDELVDRFGAEHIISERADVGPWVDG